MRSTDRTALKADIIELFRAVEREITELGTLKEDVKKLVERWKTGRRWPDGAELASARGAGAIRSHRRVDVHREGLVAHLARRLRRRRRRRWTRR